MKAVIFDMDGTLVSSMPYWGECFKTIVQGEIEAVPENLVEILTPMGIKMGSQYIHDLGHRLSGEEIYNKIEEIMSYNYINYIPLKPHASELIKSLKEKGYVVGILSASTPKMIEACMKSKGVWKYLDFARSSDSFGLAKKDPEIFKRAAEFLNINVSDICMIDDSIHVMKAAKEAGATSIGIYDDEWKDFVDRAKENSDKYVYTFEELLNEF